MGNDATEFLTALDDRVSGILDACTACGDCVRVCPTPVITGTGVSDAEGVAAGVLDILKGFEGSENARQWAAVCCGSGHCLDVCEHGINPRFMLVMARRAMSNVKAADERKQAGKVAFKKMSRAARVISRLQLPPALMERLSPSSHPEREAAPDLIFYTGCNMPKTPHIGLLCLDTLDALGASYEVHGGPSNCCGILQLRPGDTANAGRQANTTIGRFADTGTSEVVSWCPTCHIQFGETVKPERPAAGAAPFETSMFPVYLARQLDQLRPLMTRRVEKRVALHEYPGAPGVTESVIALLSAIPGLEFVDLKLPSIGYQITSLATMPEFQKQHIAGTLKAAADAGVDTLVGVYHADHRELSAHEPHWPFEIANYMELVGESLGFERPDIFKRMKQMQDADAIMTAAAEMIEVHGLDAEEVRDVVLNDLLGDQYLPVDPALHPDLSDYPAGSGK